jgi:hypothetical protein
MVWFLRFRRLDKIDIIGNKDLDWIYRMKQDKNVEKSMIFDPVYPINPVKKINSNKV